MLNNLTNFFNLITSRKIKSVPEGTDLIPLATRDKRYSGNYQPTGITVDDFIASIPIPSSGVQSVTGLNTNNGDPLNPVVQISVNGTTVTGNGTPSSPLAAPYQSPSVDGVTITGTGTPGNPLVAAGGTVNYTKVLFVDSVYGNDSTGLAGKFTKPYATIATAYSNGSSQLVGANDRALIYVRAGTYVNVNNVYLSDRVDIYLEPGCVLQEVSFFDDTSTGKNIRIFGRARIINTSTFSVIRILSDATVYFEFDTAVLYTNLVFATLTAKVTVRGRQAYMNYLGGSTQNLFQLRNSASLDAIITDYCKSEYNSVLLARQDNVLGGVIRLECPRIEVITGTTTGFTAYGVIYADFAVSTTKITIIGNIYYSGPTYQQTRGAVSTTSSSGCSIYIKGDIYSGNLAAIRTAYLTAGGNITVEGNITSGTYLIDTAASGSANVNFSILLKNGTFKSPLPTIVGEGIKLYIQNALINVTGNTDIFTTINSLAGYPSGLYLYNVNAITADNTKLFINSGSASFFTIGCVDTHSNVAFGTGVDTFGGYSQIASLVVPNF